jgi:hypothetical protein
VLFATIILGIINIHEYINEPIIPAIPNIKDEFIFLNNVQQIKGILNHPRIINGK